MMLPIQRVGPGRLCNRVGFLKGRSCSAWLHPPAEFCLPRPREGFPTALMAMSKVSMDMFLVSLVSRVFLPDSKVESSPVVSRLGGCMKLPGLRSWKQTAKVQTWKAKMHHNKGFSIFTGWDFDAGSPLPLPRCAANMESLTPLQIEEQFEEQLNSTRSKPLLLILLLAHWRQSWLPQSSTSLFLHPELF